MLEEIKAAVDFLVDLVTKRANVIETRAQAAVNMFALPHFRNLPSALQNIFSGERATPSKHTNSINQMQIANFGKNLEQILAKRYEKVWYPSMPSRGQAFRCIRINGNSPVDPNIKEAADLVGISYDDLNFRDLELSVWIDPKLVCARVGEDGYPFEVAKFDE